MTHPPLHGPALVLMTLAVALASFMNVLDTTIANVAIPAIAGDLGVSPSQGTWVITSFAVSTAIALPLTGWLARRFGEVKLFIVSTLLFTLTSWLCGLATNLPMLILFRILQGAVAGPMMPLSQTLMLANYPPEKKGLGLALWSMTIVVAPIFGPIMGGWITDNISWPWIFYINIPVGLLSAYVTWQILHKRESNIVKSPIDVVGLLLLLIGVGSLQLMLDKGNELDWFESGYIVTLAIVTIVSLTFFIAWELTEKHPVVDLSLFSRRNFTVGTISLSLAYMTFFGSVVIFPLWLQTQMGYTATWAGLAAAPIGILSLIFSPIVGRNLHRVDLRILATISFLVFALVCFWTATFTIDVSFKQLILPRFVQGIGIAFFFVPLTTILLSGLPPQQIASASGLANFMRVAAGSFGASLSVTLWDNRETLHYSQLNESISDYNPASDRMLDRLHDLGMQDPAALQQLSGTVTRQSYMLATNDIFWLAGWIFLALTALVWFTRPPFIGTKHGGKP